ncbi:hypothetical protein SteCoe_19014 [Stentor coeruleus]|uniref:Globin family profile domain-containing protein n=1 Tax=Stentor coeruleus TaxID=5963 RepID=A0A1R2BV52_9CILI|nr:hypothetical protein SteCoe_19014 [Stentor coeruleus]
MDSVYDRYGGQPFWEDVLNIFYDKNLADPELQSFFVDKDIERAKTMNRGLLAAALRPEGEHFPVSVKRTHKNMPIFGRHFNKFGENLIATLNEKHVTQADIDEIIGVIQSFKDDIVKT